MQTQRREAMQEEGNTACPSCRAVLVAGMRFCRMCGYRLGEGVEEYAATQRFDAPPVTAPAPPAAATDPFAQTPLWGAQPVRPMQPAQAAPLAGQGTPSSMWTGACSTKRAGWLTWVIIAIVLMTTAGVVPKVIRNIKAKRAAVSAPAPTVSFLDELDGIETADGGGVFLEGLAGPNSSIERAGLVGGDIITKLDGKPVRDDDDLRRLLSTTTPGKTVEVEFIRDGAAGKTNLTLNDRRDWHGTEPIDNRPGGRGVLGANIGKRLRVPDSNIFGVELSGVFRNQPAHLAGLQKGDIVIEFNGKIVRTPGDLRLRIYEAEPGSTVPVVVVRDGQTLTIALKMGRGRDD